MTKRSPWDDPLRSRSVQESRGGVGSNPPHPKPASHQKTGRGAGNTVRYMGEHGGKEDGHLYDQNGQELTPDEAQDRLKEWDLSKDNENLSPKARKASLDELKEMKDAEKYQARQTSHLIISLPQKHKDVTDEQLREFAIDFLKPFKDQGHEAVFAIHRHQNKPHIHFVVKTQGDNGKLRTNREILNQWRDHAVEVGKKHGLKMTNTKRKDRAHVREDVAAGYDKMKSGWKSRKEIPITKSAPNWYERWGYDLEVRRSKSNSPTIKPEGVTLPRLHPLSERELDLWTNATFKDPKSARASFLELGAENKGTAYWYAVNKPELFGATNEKYEPLKPVNVRLSDEWQEQAWEVLKNAKRPLRDSDVIRKTAAKMRANASDLSASNQRKADKAYVERIDPALRNRGAGGKGNTRTDDTTRPRGPWDRPGQSRNQNQPQRPGQAPRTRER